MGDYSKIEILRLAVSAGSDPNSTEDWPVHYDRMLKKLQEEKKPEELKENTWPIADFNCFKEWRGLCPKCSEVVYRDGLLAVGRYIQCEHCHEKFKLV